MGPKHAVFTVNRNEVVRLNESQHELQFFLAGMTGYVNFLVPTGDDIGTEAHEVVDGTADTGFVAGIGVAEMMTVSPGMMLTLRWLLEAIRDNPAIGSPWLPVVRMRT